MRESLNLTTEACLFGFIKYVVDGADNYIGTDPPCLGTYGGKEELQHKKVSLALSRPLSTKSKYQIRVHIVCSNCYLGVEFVLRIHYSKKKSLAHRYTILWNQDDSRKYEQTALFKNNVCFITVLQK